MLFLCRKRRLQLRWQKNVSLPLLKNVRAWRIKILESLRIRSIRSAISGTAEKGFKHKVSQSDEFAVDWKKYKEKLPEVCGERNACGRKRARGKFSIFKKTSSRVFIVRICEFQIFWIEKINNYQKIHIKIVNKLSIITIFEGGY